MRSAARSAGASFAAPPGGIRQHEQVQTGEQEQRERQQRQEAHPDAILPTGHGEVTFRSPGNAAFFRARVFAFCLP
jgi:hypothetical protein